MEPTITIPFKQYQQLLFQAELLEALEICGVDNWEGWNQALSMIEEHE